jgi:fructokinase
MSDAPAPASAITADDVIVVGGEALYDLVVDGSDNLRGHPGGAAFTTARTIGRLQQPVAYLGRLSTDRFGTRLERMLAADSVRLDAVVRTEDPTTLALAEIDDNGSARYRFYERATSAPGLTTDVALAALPAAVSILHIGTLGLTLEPMATAYEAVVEELHGKALIVVDPNIRPWAVSDDDGYRRRLRRVLAHSDVVKVSEEDLAWLDPQRAPSAAARALLDACVAELREAGVPVTGELVRSVGSHADVAERILRRAAELRAGAVVLGPDGPEATIGAGVTARVASRAPTHVVVLNPRAGALGRPLAGVAGVADAAELWDA